MQEKFFIKNKHGETLSGLVEYPKKKKDKNPAVILVHGFHMDRHEGGMYDFLSRQLTGEGYIVVRFDFAGCGKSTGDFIDQTLSKEVEDLDLIVNYTKRLKNVAKIGIAARSFGTASTIILNPQVDSIIISSSAGDHLKTLPLLFGENYNPNGVSWRKRSDGRVTEINKNFIKDISQYDLFKEINKIHVPVMLLHGDKDTKIHFRNTQLLFEKANDPKKEVIIKGAGHNWEPGQKKEIKEIIRWFNKYL